MANDFYNHGSFPSTASFGSSAQMRAELDLIGAGFDKMPSLSGNALKLVGVSSTADALGVKAVYVTDTGYMGVGTSSPATFGVLAVQKDLGSNNIVTVAVSQPNAATGAAHGAEFAVYEGTLKTAYFRGYRDGTGKVEIFNTQAGSLLLGTNNTARLAITSAGAVGIGTSTLTSGAMLDVFNASGSTVVVRSGAGNAATLQIAGNNNTPASGGVTLQQDASGDGYLINQAGRALGLGTSGAVHQTISSSGNVGLGTTSPSAKLDINAAVVRLRSANTPASASASGNAGDICWDSNYVYVCVATNTWKRAALSTW